MAFDFRGHPSLRIGSVLKLDFEARLELDERTPTRAIGLDQPQFDVRSPRIGVSGSMFDNGISFEVSRDPSEGDALWKDAYVNFRFSRAFEVEVGRFKLPFGREMLTGRSNLDFAYRSLAATTLSPSRDVGVMTHGRAMGRKLRYEAGYFLGDGDNARTKQTRGAADTAAGRILLEPFSSLQIGVAAATSRLEDQLGLRGLTVFEDGVFFDRVYVNGRRQRTGLEAAWASGPVSLSSEYVLVSDERKGMGLTGDNLPNVRARAWYVAGTWALTGEEKDGRLEPERPFPQRGFGALELAVRIEELRFDKVSYPGIPEPGGLQENGDLVTTLGINWYLNRFVKVQPNLVIESLRDPQRSPAPSTGGRFISGVVRLQFVL